MAVREGGSGSNSRKLFSTYAGAQTPSGAPVPTESLPQRSSRGPGSCRDRADTAAAALRPCPTGSYSLSTMLESVQLPLGTRCRRPIHKLGQALETASTDVVQARSKLPQHPAKGTCRRSQTFSCRLVRRGSNCDLPSGTPFRFLGVSAYTQKYNSPESHSW